MFLLQISAFSRIVHVSVQMVLSFHSENQDPVVQN